MKGRICQSCGKINPADRTRCSQCNTDIEFERILEVEGLDNGHVAEVPYRYSVYSHPSLGHEVIKNGFSWPAFFFTWIWAFIKKLWGYGIGFIVVLFLLLVIESVLQERGSSGGVLIMLFLQFAAFIIFGVNGNKWRSESMGRRGYNLIGRSLASTPDGALSDLANNSGGFVVEESVMRESAGGRSKDAGELGDYEIFERIADELENGETDRALWTQALALSEGDADKQKALYVKLRASKIRGGEVTP